MTKKKFLALGLPVFIVLILDQYTKWLIRTTPGLQNQEIIEGWLEFYYTQNPGMALGIDILSTPIISSIAILATIGIFIFVLKSMPEANVPYLICMGLILGGALGNITDRIFMGIIEGYGGVLDGHVVDFIYFSLQINDWTVFPYIFNVADVGISTAIIAMFVFHKQVFKGIEEESHSTETGEESEEKSISEAK